MIARAREAGVAVVATQGVGSAVEFIRADHNGLLAVPGDPGALAFHLARLVDQPDDRRQLASAALATMAQWPVERGAAMIVQAAQEAVMTCADS